MIKNDEFQAAFDESGNPQLPEKSLSMCERPVCHMYGKKKFSSVNKAQYAIFQQTYAPQNVEDPLKSIKGINPSVMPPCAKVLLKKLECCLLCSICMKKCRNQESMYINS